MKLEMMNPGQSSQSREVDNEPEVADEVLPWKAPSGQVPPKGYMFLESCAIVADEQVGWTKDQ